MKTTGAKLGSVLQGYFRVIPGTALDRSAPRPPRPALLPVILRGAAVQARPGGGAGGPWSGAPRPELLPGMGPSRPGGSRGAVQRRSGAAVATPVPAGHLRVLGSGRPLDVGIRQAMERVFQADFSRVRIHEGLTAQRMGALAFTLGEALHFAPGLYDPASREGLALLGHELTHVVQQREGRVTNPYGHGVAIVQDPALEAEADRMGQQIVDELSSRSRTGQPAIARAMQPARPARWVTGRPGPGPAGEPGPARPAQRVVQRAFWNPELENGLQLQANKLLHVDVIGSGLLHGTCVQREDDQYVQLGHKNGTQNAYYLPWKNGDVTSCTLEFGTALKYFFTASLSGCSIFCKYPTKTTITILHEARTDKDIHRQHERDGFQLVFNSNESVKWGFHAIDLKVMESSPSVIKKAATDFVVYGVVNENSVTFCIQERLTVSSANIETETSESKRTLVQELATTI